MYVNEKLPVHQNVVLKDRRIIALSPIAQVFNPNASIEPFLENPSLVSEKPKSLGGKAEEIDIIVPLSSRTYTFKLGEVYTVTADEANVLVGNQNGGQWSALTNGSGLVYFDVPEDVLIAYQFARKSGEKVSRKVQDEIEKYTKIASDWSEKRILDFIKRIYNDVVQGRSTIAQSGGTPPSPNDREMLYTFILKDRIAQTKQRRAQLTEAFKEATSEIDAGDVALI